MSMENVLTLLLSENDLLLSDSSIKAIAELGVSIGYDNLSDDQKEAIHPYLNRACEGVELPSGELVACTNIVYSVDLENSLLHKGRHNADLCSECLTKREDLLQQLERLECLSL